MTVKYGFYDSLNGDRLYNANDIGTMFEGIFSDGVFESVGNALEVINVAGTMNVLVKDGRAWFNHLWIRNTTNLSLALEASDIIHDRIDVVVLEFNSEITVRENSIKVLTGVPAATPIPPVLANTTTLKQYALAHVRVNALVSEILVSDITDKRGTVNTPYASYILSGQAPVGSGGGAPTFVNQSGGTGDTYGVISGTINGTNTDFTVSGGIYASATLKVWLNGQLLTQGTSEDWVELSPAAGTFRFNTAPIAGDMITVEFSTSAPTSNLSFHYNESPTGSIDGTNKIFTCTTEYVSTSLLVFRDGQLMTKDEDYTETTPASGIFTFTTAPVVGSVIRVSYQESSAGAFNSDTLDGYHVSDLVLKTSVREVLVAHRTYYVRTDGSDSNNGLTDTPSGAFLTIQKAIDNSSSVLDTSLYNIIIQIADGTYVANTITCKNISGSGTVTIQGNATTPSNVIIDGGFLKNTPGTNYTIKNLRIKKNVGSATTGIHAQNQASIYFSNIDFNTGLTICVFAQGATIEAIGGWSHTGGATYGLIASSTGNFTAQGFTITLTGTPAFTYYVLVDTCGVMKIASNTFSGSATGTRYVVSLNGVISVGGAGINYLPGNGAGATATGGQYA